VAPVITEILLSSVPTLSVMLTWFPVAPEATNVRVVPSTVMVSPGANPATSESVPVVPERAVLAVIGFPSWLLTTGPVWEASMGGAGEPIGKGLEAKSDGLMPPAAVSVPEAAPVLAGVFGWVGRFAA
jgi:hypothetical protein